MEEAMEDERGRLSEASISARERVGPSSRPNEKLEPWLEEARAMWGEEGAASEEVAEFMSALMGDGADAVDEAELFFGSAGEECASSPTTAWLSRLLSARAKKVLSESTKPPAAPGTACTKKPSSSSFCARMAAFSRLARRKRSSGRACRKLRGREGGGMVRAGVGGGGSVGRNPHLRHHLPPNLSMWVTASAPEKQFLMRRRPLRLSWCSMLRKFSCMSVHCVFFGAKGAELLRKRGEGREKVCVCVC